MGNPGGRRRIVPGGRATECWLQPLPPGASVVISGPHYPSMPWHLDGRRREGGGSGLLRPRRSGPRSAPGRWPQRFRDDQAGRTPRARIARQARDATKSLTVTRLAGADGTITLAGTQYRAGRTWARPFPGVTIAADSGAGSGLG